MNASNATIQERLERLKFIIDEMQIAYHIANNTSDQFLARTVARHILIRAENFILHASQLRKPLNIAGFNTSLLHGAKEVFASDFEDNYLELRHKLGAHVQDLDFGRHVEIWLELESDKVSYILNEATLIYKNLARLNIPGYIPYIELSSLSINAIATALEKLRRESASEGYVEFASDTLAMTRENATAMFNATPIHQRAGQLALLRRWIEIENDLLKRFSADIAVARILKARIITDIVSFCDCLLTRPISADQPQFMEGLDKLVQAASESFRPVHELIAASKYDEFMLDARNIRNSIGSHVSDDFTKTLAQITSEIDQYDVGFAITYFHRLHQAFRLMCSDIMYLKPYAFDGERAYGVTPGREGVTPYCVEQGGSMSYPPLAMPIYNQDEYFKQFQLWRHGDEEGKANARQYFYNAFMHAPCVEVVEETTSMRGSHFYNKHNFLDVHRFIVTVAESSLEDEFGDVLTLLNACGRGYALAEAVIRFGKSSPQNRQRQICYLLGEIRSYPHVSVESYLKLQAKSLNWEVKLAALLSLYKMRIGFDGLNRCNRVGYVRDYDSLVRPLLKGQNTNENLLCEIAFASCLRNSSINYCFEHFKENYAQSQLRIRKLCEAIVSRETDQFQLDMLDQLLGSHDYIGLCVWVSQNIVGGKERSLTKAMLNSCCLGLVTPLRHDQSTRHLAICFHLLGHHEEASQMMEEIAYAHPDVLAYQILAIQLFEETSPPVMNLLQRIDLVRRSYQLAPEDEAVLREIEVRANSVA